MALRVHFGHPGSSLVSLGGCRRDLVLVYETGLRHVKHLNA